MEVLAKFKVQSVHHQYVTPEECCAVVTLNAVQGTGNESWSKYTPSGIIKMTINNPSAVAAFEIGKDYLVSFKPDED